MESKKNKKLFFLKLFFEKKKQKNIFFQRDLKNTF
tara:strand:+ start:355 stop:459 length:105 start_codon:yes stop_codon:yes gene_type:complete